MTQEERRNIAEEKAWDEWGRDISAAWEDYERAIQVDKLTYEDMRSGARERYEGGEAMLAEERCRTLAGAQAWYAKVTAPAKAQCEARREAATEIYHAAMQAAR